MQWSLESRAFVGLQSERDRLMCHVSIRQRLAVFVAVHKSGYQEKRDILCGSQLEICGLGLESGGDLSLDIRHSLRAGWSALDV